ncbi:keratin, type I cytoskeletal 10-like [Helianthus annuus]|uniref:keratin, type I cytoskeletal 10-like n=1 Tax=Helianthus annuus TaxID=4232 RepID=UPI000B8FC791|nr:keratin, type I cytoskeletal 10-like [Helianthus annuus]
MSAYCQALKVIFDQLTNLGSPITDEQLVLQLLTGLNDQYENTASVIQQMKPLPDFYDTRSRLCMAESRKLNQVRHAARTAGTALNATVESRDKPEHREQRADISERGRGRSRGRGHGRGQNGGWNDGRGSGGRGSGSSSFGYGGQNSTPVTTPFGGFYLWTFFAPWAGPNNNGTQPQQSQQWNS